MPHLIIIAGCNGSGKTTTAPALLQNALHVDDFVNADAIAHSLCAFQPEKASIQAGRIMLETNWLLKKNRFGKNLRRLTVGNKISKNDDSISIILNDSAKVTMIIQEGIKTALLKHKQAGNPVCEWRDNKVVWISPENIPVGTKK